MKNLRTQLLATALIGTVSFGWVQRVHANVITDGGFTSFSGTAPGANYGEPSSNLADWGGGGYNFVFTQTASGDFNDAASQTGVEMWNANNGGTAPDSIGLPFSGYTGNMIAADGAYEVGPITQTITGLIPGSQYSVTFYWGAAQQTGFNGDTTESWTVNLGSDSSTEQSTSTFSLPSHTFSGWMQDTMVFTPTVSSEALSFLPVGAPGEPPFSLLADVDVEVVPEAPTYFVAAFLLLPVSVRALRMLHKKI